MALKRELETLDGLSQDLQAFYVEQDGKFVLDVEPDTKNTDTGRIPKARLDQEILKRKEAETELNTLVEEMKEDIPEEYQELVPDLPPGKLLQWLRKAQKQGLFNSSLVEPPDTRRPGKKPAEDISTLSPVAKMSRGYKQ